MSFLKSIEAWVVYLWAHFQHHGAVPAPPNAETNNVPVTVYPLPTHGVVPTPAPITVTPAPITPDPIVVPVHVIPIPPVSGDPVVGQAGPNPLDPGLDNADMSSYEHITADGFCTVREVEAMRAEIEAADPSYLLPHFYLCPAVLHTIPDVKTRIAQEWQLSQVSVNNWAEANPIHPELYPAYVVEISVRPGMEAVEDTVPLKWSTSRGPALGYDYVAVSSVPTFGMVSGAAIAEKVRSAWLESKRRRNM